MLLKVDQRKARAVLLVLGIWLLGYSQGRADGGADVAFRLAKTYRDARPGVA